MPRQVLFPPADPELREAFLRAWEAWAHRETATHKDGRDARSARAIPARPGAIEHTVGK